MYAVLSEDFYDQKNAVKFMQNFQIIRELSA